MNVTLINPNIVSQKGDVSGSGIPYMPIALAYLAAYLRERGDNVQVIDAFGAAPETVRVRGRYYVQGLTADEVASQVADGAAVIGFFAHLTVAHSLLVDLIAAVGARRPGVPTFVFENVDKVNAYSLRQVRGEFFAAGIDYVVLGYPEVRTGRLLDHLAAGEPTPPIDGVIRASAPDEVVPPRDAADSSLLPLDQLPLPAWDLFPLENYWRLGYAHGPLSAPRYLPLLTSRGCPFGCGFCLIPEVSGRRWQPRSAENVVAEIETVQRRYGVDEFHVEDLNPTVDRRRTIEICRLLVERNIRIRWKLAQGTKLETLDREVVDHLARAGCTYVSISPESGSERVLKAMGKPVDRERAVQVTRWMRAAGIRSQACLVLGYPGETSADRRETLKLTRRLARAGLDEVAAFIITPMPGSRIYHDFESQFHSLEQLTFSPTWRDDYKTLAAFRKRLYAEYALLKLVFHPLRAFGYLVALVRRRFDTKVEMTIYRKAKVAWLARAGRRPGP